MNTDVNAIARVNVGGVTGRGRGFGVQEGDQSLLGQARRCVVGLVWRAGTPVGVGVGDSVPGHWLALVVIPHTGQVQAGQKHRPHPGPVLPGVGKGTHQVIGLLDLGHFLPIPVWPVAGDAALGGVHQPAKAGGPDGGFDVAQVFHGGALLLGAAEGHAPYSLWIFLWRVGKAVGVRAQRVKVTLHPSLVHPTDEGQVAHV